MGDVPDEVGPGGEALQGRLGPDNEYMLKMAEIYNVVLRDGEETKKKI